jgi:hypothetical protein
VAPLDHLEQPCGLFTAEHLVDCFFRYAASVVLFCIYLKMFATGFIIVERTIYRTKGMEVADTGSRIEAPTWSLVSYSFSIGTNAVSTLMIAYRAW